MESLVERLRDRSAQRPVYNIEDSDDEADLHNENYVFEKIQRPDAKKGSCQACGQDDNLWSCEMCNYTYHAKCLLPPMRGPLPSSWKCPECTGPLNEIEKILSCGIRPTAADYSDISKLGSDQVFVKQYLVKWKGLSHLHCTWIPEKELIKALKSNPRLRTKITNFHKKESSTDESGLMKSEYTTVDRIIACRGSDDDKEYLVKWMGVPYDECYWELESDMASFQKEIEKFNRIQSRHEKVSVAKQKINLHDGTDSTKKLEEFQQFESTPKFLSGSLYSYQLEGLNFLRYSWLKQTHVILADEMGLGKTIQGIAFLTSLFEKNKYPHLVISPLSTLLNWEREFAVWAPHINVVTYIGSSSARAVIREYEFYYLKNQKTKKKKFNEATTEIKQDKTRFDVLLTTFEIINMDASLLKSIKWECMIVDEGHRLKNEESKIFFSLKQFSSRHRSLFTGTPLQNSLDELFTLLHFLDAGKFGGLEEFKDINQEEQISRLHKMLAPHILRRLKKDVMSELPPKKELLLRVELSSMQKEYYKAILTRNYQVLTQKGGSQISLINVVMELRKLCCHPFMLEGVEPKDDTEFNKQLLECSGKLQLLDKMMVKLKEQGHRILIFSQFLHMLDLLEDYCVYKNWHYERVDGKVNGAERQIRIDRFNAKNSSKFCFLLSTRAGGVGINLATADTVIVYDSDWNPHADIQAMARAHRVGQINKVMVYRLVTRGTIEERMMQMTKQKMVLEHVVVGKLRKQNLNQEELDDIIRYGSKELFADDNDELAKSHQIHYDDTAIDKLLNRDENGEEEASSRDEVDKGDFQAIKVANCGYISECDMKTEEEPPAEPAENRALERSPERARHWEDLLQDKYEVHQVEAFNSSGKGKRNRKQMMSIKEDELVGLEDVTSDGEDENYEAELIDSGTASAAATVRMPHKKRPRDTSEPHPLMEGEGRDLRVLGFNQNQRALFVHIVMRFGLGNFDWGDFTQRLKQKTYKEIIDYGRLFMSHIAEEITDLLSFSDGVPKEGLRIQDVLVRIATLLLIREKVKALSKEGSTAFQDDIITRYPGLKGGKIWNEQHDLLLLQAVLKHGYGRWQAMIDDKDIQIQEAICQELNLPFANVPVAGISQAYDLALENCRVQLAASVDSEDFSPTPGFSHLRNGQNSEHLGESEYQAMEINDENESGANVALGAADIAARVQPFQNQSASFHCKQMQRRQVEFIKKRVLLLEKGLNAEQQKIYFGDEITKSMRNDEKVPKVTDLKNPSSKDSDILMIDQLLRVDYISQEEVLAISCDKRSDRLDMARLYNEMCKIVTNNGNNPVETYLADTPESLKLKRNLDGLQTFNEEINLALSGPQRKVKSPPVVSAEENAQKKSATGSTPFAEDTSNINKTNTLSGAGTGTITDVTILDPEIH